MAELNRAQLQAWESSLHQASSALEFEGAGPARLRGRLRNMMSALRESLETVRRLLGTVAAQRQQLAAEEKRFTGIMDHLPIPYLLTTADGTVLRINNAASRALNISCRAVVGRNLLVFLDDREGWMQALSQVIASGAVMRRAGRLRPRERLQTAVDANLSVADTPAGPAIQWFLTEGRPEHDVQGGRRCTPRPASMPSSPPSS